MQYFDGQCHCGAVKFRVQLANPTDCYECNCSICYQTGFLHLIVPKDQFELLSGEESLTTYRFNTGVAIHRFCQHCGVKPFYTPRSNPNGVDVNLRCLHTPPSVRMKSFDGQNWEANAAALKHLS